MTTSKTFSPALISFLMLPFVVVVSLVLVFLDLERRESVSNAQIASDVNRIYSRAHGVLNEFYWKSADTTLGVTLQSVQKNLFTDFDHSHTAHPIVDKIALNTFKLNASVSQIRWINAGGVERYRMNRVKNGQTDEVEVVLGEALQDKSQRYYFTETQTLNSGDIYLSRLDLNVENGQIVEPFEPTIRMATPVKNDRNEFQGIVVINFSLINVFRRLDGLAIDGIDIDLFNEDGYLRYSHSSPEAAFLDIFSDNIATVEQDTLALFYKKSDLFQRATGALSDYPHYTQGSIEFAPQVVSQEDIKVFITVQDDYLQQAFKENLTDSIVLGIVTFLFGAFLLFFLYRSDQKVKALNRVLNKQLVVSENAREIKTQFLANMSHEIRTPMTAIAGLLELLLKEKLDENVRKRLNVIKDSSDGLRRIINDILDLSKVESGKSTLLDAEFRPSLTIERCVSTFNGLAGLKGSELLLDMQPNLFFYYCRGDEYRIEQVVNNLLSNAIKFSNNNPITIAVSSSLKNEDTLSVTCSITDLGIGMPESLIKTLGETFTQADNNVSKENDGTGLGLSISKALLRSMNTDLRVSSQLGAGSTFSFTIDLAVVKKTEVLTNDTIQLDTLNVWMISKDAHNTTLINKLFRHWGCKVVVIQTQDELERLIAGRTLAMPSLDFVLFDLEHGVSDDDIAFMTTHLNQQQAHPVRWVVMTADESKWSSHHQKSIYIEFLKKPITISGFLEMLQKLQLVPSIQAVEDKQETTLKALEKDVINRVETQGQPRILLVEDNLTNQEVIKAIFESIQIDIEVASDGKEAIDMVIRHPIDLVFMDVQMPVMNGLEATSVIRHSFSQKQLPIVALSAGVTEAELSQANQVGMNTCLSKPIDLNKLMQVLIEYWPEPEVQKVPAINTHLSIEDLSHLARFDLSNTVYQWLGHEVYMKVLNSFITEYSEVTVPETQKEKVTFAHTLKGASGNIGAVELFSLSDQLEQQLAKEDVSIQRLIDELAEDIVTLRRVTPSN